MPDSLRRSPRVLLVEDSEDDAFFFRWTLQKCGVSCELVHVVDGGAALSHLKDVLNGRIARPDLVFLDLKLPMYSGFDVLTWIKAQHFDPPLTVFILSGSEHASDVARARELVAAGYFVKPISAQQLLRQLHDVGFGRSHAETSVPA